MRTPLHITAALLVLAFLAAGCGSGSGGSNGCTPMETRSCYSGPAGTLDVGACRAGTQACGGDGVWAACAGDVTPATEACDGIDNNCDGTTDEGDPGGGQPCDSGLHGVCAGGTTVCSGGAVQCVQDQQASAEACNGLDDDCDGTVDEGCECIDGRHQSCYSDSPATLGVGECIAGQQTCSVGQWGLCLGEVVPTTESCDSKDNDCDGATDEEGATDCSTYYRDQDGDGYGVGSDSECLCASTGQYTASQAGDCNDTETGAGIHPGATEVCNGIDDDCDGVTDEEGATGCSTYYRDQDGDGYGLGSDGKCWCAASGPYAATQTGECNDTDTGIHPGAYEVCNGLDDDCNGMTDASDSGAIAGGYFTQDAPLCELQTGVCAGARKLTALCVSGAWTACNTAAYTANSSQYQAGTETSCDGRDNDCDGQTDEDFGMTLPDGATVQGVGKACGTGRCAGGVTLCKADKIGIYCSTESNAANEVCNSLDDDCNGMTDAADSAAISGGFFTHDAPMCELQTGVCSGARKLAAMCAAGAWSPCDAAAYTANSSQYEAGTETLCDTYDNDCDGASDEGLPHPCP